MPNHSPVSEEFIDNQSAIIRLLPPEIANKIAAGEVVQRPSSVVKELLDNAIDAGASAISVILQQAGRTSIQVIDNGCGMSKEDIPFCFLRHATSKISSADDLYAIRTLGFRGEAMASIASVAQITLKTKRMEDDSGYLYELWGGDERVFEPVATENGTSVAVRNLFFNVPARRSFLKTDATELRHSILIFQKMALSNPGIAFKLITDTEVVYDLPVQSLEERIADIYGKSYKASLIPFDETAGFVRISGLLSDPKLTKKNRGEQFLFVNGRPIMHRHLSHVILEQYKSWISETEFPFFAIFYDVDPNVVDVNVHPSKMEIKFEDERTVSMLTKSVIKRALNQRYQVPDLSSLDNVDYEPFPNVYSGSIDTAAGTSGHMVQKFPSRINFPARLSGVSGTGSISKDLYDHPSRTSGIGNTEFDRDGLRSGQRQAHPERERSVGFWQLHQSYIIAQTLTGMCMVDQNAAHKRIIYERSLHAMEAGIPATQQLLFPQTLQLSASDYTQLKNVLPDLLRMGFDISMVSGFTVIINGVPADIQLGDEKSLIQSIIQQYAGYPSHLDLGPRQKLALAFASKTAIPRGKKLSHLEMETIMDQLFACEQPYADPLQKPIISYVSLDDIRSRFRN